MKLDSAVFYTNDLEKVVDFYKNKIGLEVEYINEGRFASFKFGNGVRLGIKKALEEREKPGSQTIFIEEQNVEKLYGKYKKEKISFYKELKEESWGTEFAILDPDGNKIEFLKRK
jgi:catechol 2,3-dioxygenase-like lactoylglutathione lyase family enzyme